MPLSRPRCQLVLELRRHAQEDGPGARRGSACAPARLERDGEAGGEDADGDVVEALPRAANLAGEEPLQLAGHPDKDIFARRC